MSILPSFVHYGDPRKSPGDLALDLTHESSPPIWIRASLMNTYKTLEFIFRGLNKSGLCHSEPDFGGDPQYPPPALTECSESGECVSDLRRKRFSHLEEHRTEILMNYGMPQQTSWSEVQSGPHVLDVLGSNGL